MRKKRCWVVNSITRSIRNWPQNANVSDYYLRHFNDISDDQRAERIHLIQQIIPMSGKGLLIEPPFYCDYGNELNFWVAYNTQDSVGLECVCKT